MYVSISGSKGIIIYNQDDDLFQKLNRTACIVYSSTMRIAVFLILVTSLPVFAGTPVRIESVVTDISGKTRSQALLRELRIAEGQVFADLDTLERQLNARADDLIRRRIFRNFEYTVNSLSPESVSIYIRVTDSFTLLPRPLIKYSTNRGLTAGLRMQYYNAFGTLTDQMLQGYWSPHEILFEAEIRNIIIGPAHMDALIEQFDGTTRYGNPFGDVLVEYHNSRTQFQASVDMPLTESSPWSYQFSPLFSWYYNYRFQEKKPVPYEDSWFTDEGFTPGLEHGIMTDQTRWTGNFRRGFAFELMNKNKWYTGSDNQDIFLETDLKGYVPLNSMLELSGRAGAFCAFGSLRENAGDRLRGVVDYMTYGEWGFFLSAQINILTFRVPDKLSVHIRPFTDTGYVYSRIWGPGYNAWEYCIGATLITYFDALPSLALNIDWGWDLKRNMPELIIDTVHFL